ncbi:nuclease-related domain-containing protein [uncultured Microbacterium sp.]|uniref:nuclease-related domain-containing protein n=1 Tax=uncultured Microbacterium sp. TaxID=191216 RepID=UPI00261DC82C|nr:nuclease-related domain-containing protein [uncultured Microbacterium sp.]
MDGDKEMNLRFAGTCTLCGHEIAQGARAIYSRPSRSVRHIDCSVGFDRGTPGGSAQREYERRRAKDDARVAEQKANVQAVFGAGLLGKVATRLAVDDGPRRSTDAWAHGAAGEEHVADSLDQLAEAGAVALHDRRIPGSRANIDHIAITPWGVWVIDAKRYRNQRPAVVTEGGLFGFGGTERLTVGGRKKDALVEGVLWQVEHVQAVVGEAATVQGALAFVDADWPLIGGDFTVRGVTVLWPRRLTKLLLRQEAPTVDVDPLARLIAARFPPA